MSGFGRTDENIPRHGPTEAGHYAAGADTLAEFDGIQVIAKEGAGTPRVSALFFWIQLSPAVLSVFSQYFNSPVRSVRLQPDEST